MNTLTVQPSPSRIHDGDGVVPRHILLNRTLDWLVHMRKLHRGPKVLYWPGPRGKPWQRCSKFSKSPWDEAWWQAHDEMCIHSSSPCHIVCAEEAEEVNEVNEMRVGSGWNPTEPDGILTRIRYTGGRGHTEMDAFVVPMEIPKAVLYTVLVSPHGSQHYKPGDLVLDALFAYCTARWSGSTLPFRMIINDVNSGATKLLHDVGFEVMDFSHLETVIRQEWHKPLYSRDDALAAGRLWVDHMPVQGRVDGWATYFKLLAWNDSYAHAVLMTDVDVCFLQNPDPFLLAFAASPSSFFHATFDVSMRRYMGFNSHLMALRPSPLTFKALVQKAATGDYVPYTNGEQDVLEWYFDATLGYSFKTDIGVHIRHQHSQSVGNSVRECWHQWSDAVHNPGCSSSELALTFANPGHRLTCPRLAKTCGVKIP